MKILKSMPNDTAFFERYADLTHSLTKVATIAQVVTGAAEIGILYALLFPSIHDLAPNYAVTLSTVAAVFCAALLQFGLKKVFPYSIRAILYKRFKGLDLAFSISVFILTVALLGVSVFLSWKGSKDIASFAVAPPSEKNTIAQDSAKNAVLIAANNRFTTDSATIETKFKGKSEALTAECMSRITAIERYSNGKQATTQRAELKTKLAAMQADKATEIQAKSDKRQTDIDKATDRADSQSDEILKGNKEAKDQATNKAESYSGYIGYFTLFCYVFFLFTYILNEIYHKGAKINLTPVPAQRHFDPSVIALFMEAAKEKVDVYFRTMIYNFANNTAAQPLPEAVRVLHTFSSKTFDEVLQVQSDFAQTKIVKLPTKRHKLAATIQPETSTKTDETPQKQRQIGFKNTDDIKDETAKTAADITAAVLHEKPQPQTRNCGWCNNSFEYVVYNKVYCCEDCKKQAWAAKSGKVFDLELKKKERLKK